MMTPGKKQGRNKGRDRRQNSLTADEVMTQGTATEPHGLIWQIRIVMWLCLAAVVFVLTFRPVSDPDTWFHLKLGEYISQTGKLPHTDPFSYTAGSTPYVPSGWGTSVLMEKLDRIYPESSLGPILMVTLIIALASLVVMLRSLKSRTTLSTGVLLIIGLEMAVVRFSPRPDVWSILGIALLLSIMTGWWESQKDGGVAGLRGIGRLWLLPLLIVVWANLHAGVLVAVPFLFTFGLWLFYSWYKARDRRFLLAVIPVVIAMFAWMANPFGIGLAGLALRIAEIPKVYWVMEWMPFFRSGFPMVLPVYVTAAVLAGATVLCIAMRFKRMHPLVILWILMLVAMALLQRRQLGLSAVGVPLLLAPSMIPVENWLRNTAGRAAGLIAVFVAGIICFTQISGANGNGGGRPYMGRNCTVLPCVAADYLAAKRPPQPIFNSYNLGAYLLYRLSPKTKVYIDGRLDVYPHQVWLDMLAVEEDKLSIDDLVKRYGIQTFVIGIADSFGDPMHLASRLAARPDYMLVHLDDLTAVFVRRDNIDYVVANAYKLLSPWDLKKMAETFSDSAQQDVIITEVGRMLVQSGQSATAHALAGYVAWLGGDNGVMAQQLAIARQIRPDNRLLKVVQARIAVGFPARKQ